MSRSQRLRGSRTLIEGRSACSQRIVRQRPILANRANVFQKSLMQPPSLSLAERGNGIAFDVGSTETDAKNNTLIDGHKNPKRRQTGLGPSHTYQD